MTKACTDFDKCPYLTKSYMGYRVQEHTPFLFAIGISSSKAFLDSGSGLED